MMQGWYDVTGRGSGRRLADVHRVDVDRPFGKMLTFCGVGISSAFRKHYPRRGTECRACRKRDSAP